MSDFCPVFDLTEFSTLFPEVVECLTPEQINAASVQVRMHYRGFGGLLETQRLYATYLAVAHFAIIRFDRAKSGGATKAIRTRDDEIVYAVSNNADPFDLTVTPYGSQLAKLFKQNVFTGFTSQGFIC